MTSTTGTQSQAYDSDTESTLSTSSDLINGQPRFFGCYLLVSQSQELRSRNRTYVGFTVKPCRRLRQHNGELKRGGALRTCRHRPWRMIAVIHGFSCKVQALSFEWAWTNPARTRTLALQRSDSGARSKFPNSPRGRLRALAALCAARPWRLCPLTLTVLLDCKSWDETIGLGRKDQVQIPSNLRIEFRTMKDLADVGVYNYRMGTSVDTPHVSSAQSCMVCNKDVGVKAQQARSQCMHCGKLVCLSCLASCVTQADADADIDMNSNGDGGDASQARDRLVPDTVFCMSCKKSMPWMMAARLSRALAAEASAAYELSVTQGITDTS